MKTWEQHIEQWFENRRVKKHMDQVLAVREEMAKVSALLETRKRIKYYYASDHLETAKVEGKLAALKIRLAHLEAISRRVEPTV